MNRVEIVGRLTKDVELSYVSKTLTPCAKLFVAAAKMRKAEDGQPDADFIPVTVWGKPAELCEKYLEKGSMVGVSGMLKSGKYEAGGQARYTLDVVADRVEFLSGTKRREDQMVMPGMPEGFEKADDIPF